MIGASMIGAWHRITTTTTTLGAWHRITWCLAPDHLWHRITWAPDHLPLGAWHRITWLRRDKEKHYLTGPQKIEFLETLAAELWR